jgi:hypothetical protein
MMSSLKEYVKMAKRQTTSVAAATERDLATQGNASGKPVPSLWNHEVIIERIGDKLTAVHRVPRSETGEHPQPATAAEIVVALWRLGIDLDWTRCKDQADGLLLHFPSHEAFLDFLGILNCCPDRDLGLYHAVMRWEGLIPSKWHLKYECVMEDSSVKRMMFANGSLVECYTGWLRVNLRWNVFIPEACLYRVHSVLKAETDQLQVEFPKNVVTGPAEGFRKAAGAASDGSEARGAGSTS